jgi:hypothetical protein
VIALVLTTYTVLVGVLLPNLGAFLLGPPSLTGIAFMTWIFGWVVVAIGVSGLLSPRKTTIVLGSVGAILGPLLLLANGSDVLGEILSIASAIVLVFLGDGIADRAAAGLGIAGTLLVSVIIVGRHVSDQGPAIGVLVLGLVLLAGALLTARAVAGPVGSTAPAWEPPPPGPRPDLPPGPPDGGEAPR